MDIVVECYYPDENGICLDSNICTSYKCPARKDKVDIMLEETEDLLKETQELFEQTFKTVDKILGEEAKRNKGEKS